MAGINLYAERRPRWRVEVIRVPVLAAVVVVASVLPRFFFRPWRCRS
jgi:hypothetical protein